MFTAPANVQVSEVTADSRSRIAFGKVGVLRDDKFIVKRNNDTGEILLTPARLIPEREMLVWDNPEILASLLLGIQQAEQGLAAPWPEMDTELDAIDLDDDEVG